VKIALLFFLLITHGCGAPASWAAIIIIMLLHKFLCVNFMLLAMAKAAVRLANGGTQFEGRVEVYYNGEWGTVCDDNWDIVDAKCVTIDSVLFVLTLVHSVVCQELGYGGAIRAYTDSFFGSGSSSMPIWLDEVRCTTRDRNLSECGHAGWGITDCFHSEDAGVACTETGLL